MKITPPVVDYRELRLSNLASDQFRHLLLLIWWPLFGLLFNLTEKGLFTDTYTPIYSPFDDIIPFAEIFVIPYLFWFAYLVLMHLYLGFYDIDGFKRLMWFIMITYTTTLVIYWIFPNCQHLRPTTFERDNFLVRFMQDFYQFDTNTNVCPSIHVLGSVAVGAAGLNCPRLRSPWWKWSFVICTFLISISTVFLKQHSIIDVITAIPLCVIAYLICYRKHEVRFPVKKKTPAR